MLRWSDNLIRRVLGTVGASKKRPMYTHGLSAGTHQNLSNGQPILSNPVCLMGSEISGSKLVTCLETSVG